MVGLSVKNNTNKPIYLSQNFCYGQVQKFIYPNIEQLYHKKARASVFFCTKCLKKPRLNNLYLVYLKKDIDLVKFFEVEHFVSQKQTM